MLLNSFKKINTLSFILLFIFLIQQGQSQCCLKFSGWKCLECPSGTRLYRGNCLFNIPHCSSYIGGFDCSACNTGYELKNGQCEKQKETQKPPIQINYIPQNLNNIKKTENYTLLIDFIERTLEGYEGRNPTSVGTYDTQNIKYFLLTFTKANGSRWRISARVFKRTSIVMIDNEELISGSAANNDFENIPLDLIFKDPYFIIIRDQIDKQDARFKKGLIKSVQKFQEETQITYKILFQINENQYQIKAIADKVKNQIKQISGIPDPVIPPNPQKPKQIPPYIQKRTVGFTLLQEGAEKSDASLQAVMQRLEASNQEQLAGSTRFASFKKATNQFTFVYKLYYVVGNRVFEGEGTYQALRRRAITGGVVFVGFI